MQHREGRHPEGHHGTGRRRRRKGAEGDTRGAFSKYADLTERAIHVQKTIIRKLADRESCVIIGRCAYILKEQKPILRAPRRTRCIETS